MVSTINWNGTKVINSLFPEVIPTTILVTVESMVESFTVPIEYKVQPLCFQSQISASYASPKREMITDGPFALQSKVNDRK